MKKKERYEKVINWFQENVPVAETELHYNDPFELLIAVILSAQCTDKRVNMITPALYHDFPTPEALAASSPEVIFEYIRSVSYPNNKAKHLVGMAQMLVKDFNSKVPDTLEELIKLPGVGRKTANVIQSVVFIPGPNSTRPHNQRNTRMCPARSAGRLHKLRFRPAPRGCGCPGGWSVPGRWGRWREVWRGQFHG